MYVNTTDSFLDWDITTLSNAYKKGQISPFEVTKTLLERISSVDTELNAYITVPIKEALAQAKKAEEEIHAGNIKGPLHGVPIAIKDNIHTKHILTTMGSEIYKDYTPDNNATVIEKLTGAGAVIVGKTNIHQFAYGTTGDRSYYGPVKNPYDPLKISGGSSSGSASALASSLCFAALGTDTGGSVRIPSSFNGVVGMKPTFGRVSNRGVYPLSWSMDHVGPLTKTVSDSAILLNILSGYDEEDPYSVQTKQEDFAGSLHKGIEGTIIGVPSSAFFHANDADINTKLKEAIVKFERLGAKIKPITIPNLNHLYAAFQTILKSEAYTLHKQRLQDYPNQWDEEVKSRLFTGADTKAEEYINAQQVKAQAKRLFLKLFSEVDIILTPTVPILPTAIGQREVAIEGAKTHISSILNKWTSITNLTGFPSLSMPCGISKTGMPIGMQIIGKPFDETNIYRFASAFETTNR